MQTAGFSEEAMAESALEAVKQHLGIQEQPSPQRHAGTSGSWGL